MPVIDSNMYFLPTGESALVVDPCISRELEQRMKECRITDCLILLTHEHYDHISGVNWLRGLAKCKVMCSETCGERIQDPKKNSAAYFEALFFNRDAQTQKRAREITDPNYTCQADVSYAGKQVFVWKGLEIELTEAPGHSPGSQIIRVGGKYYFTGDYLIPGGQVITRLPGGNRRQYETATRPYLQRIGPDSFIFPGHGEPGPIQSNTLGGI
ncbi:MBL fold metallo-hydrolase [Acutalibacter caecimuris]|uniref:MBL fold metallo-hydrolase n=1 Tax=Acutalibacter caecimuris TaxID=3093657 RepID=UPI002AC939D4|nr:MBL fold metallo-hydrolase [Acutalibacter sp. M00118]